MGHFGDRARALIAECEAASALTPGAGIACTVVRGHETLYQGVFGLRDRKAGLPVTSRTRFDLASNTKPFTATALLIAAQEGKLDLGAPLAGKTDIALSDPAATQKLSALDVLSHRSGLPANDFLWYFRSPPDLGSRIARLPLVSGAHGKTFIYSNLMVGALAGAFERLVGTSWERFVRAQVLEPLGMTRALLGDESPEDGDAALPYVGEQAIRRRDTRAIAGAGGLHADVEDLARWLAFQLGAGPALLPAQSIALQRSEHSTTDAPNPLLVQGFEWLGNGATYGLGWFLGSTRGKKALFHTGFIDGFSSGVVVVPELGVGAAVLSNAHFSAVSGRLAAHLIAAALDDPSPALAPLTMPALPPSPPPPDSEVAHARAEGRFEDPAYGIVELRDGDRGPVVEYAGQVWPLTFHSAESAVLVATYFGFPIPFPVAVEVEHERIARLSIPLAMDPRVPPQVFTRV